MASPGFGKVLVQRSFATWGAPQEPPSWTLCLKAAPVMKGSPAEAGSRVQPGPLWERQREREREWGLERGHCIGPSMPQPWVDGPAHPAVSLVTEDIGVLFLCSPPQ